MNRKILLVDDDKALRETFQKGLSAYADIFTMEIASNGKEAIDKLKSQDIYLVVTDLKMPQVDGFGLLSHIIEHYPEIPVIVITGYGTPQMKKMAKESGAVGYIEKPFMIEDLAQAILTHLRKVSEGGTLHHVSSGMFLQLIEMEQKTCTIRVEDKNTDQNGVLYFRDGDLLDAKIGDQRGEEAAYEIFSWEDVSISIQNACSVKEGVIKGDIQAILLESMRRKDEAQEKADAKPSKAPEKEKQPEPAAKPDDGTVSVEEIAEDEDISNADYIRIKLRSELGDHSGLNDVYEDSSWDHLIKSFQALGKIFDTGSLKLSYLDRGDKGDVVLVPSEPNITISLKAKFPRDRIIHVLNEIELT